MTTNGTADPAAQPARRRGSLMPLWIMILVFAMPSLAAWFYFLNPEYLPEDRGNLGELIEPSVPLTADFGLTGVDGRPLAIDQLEGRWTLVYPHSGACAEDCLRRLTDLRQIRLAVGEGQGAVHRLYITDTLPDADPDGGFARAFDGMQIALANPQAGSVLLDELGPDAIGSIHILDPMGRFMMRYAPDAPASDTLKDMERLLKASKNWIKGAGYGHK